MFVLKDGDRWVDNRGHDFAALLKPRTLTGKPACGTRWGPDSGPAALLHHLYTPPYTPCCIVHAPTQEPWMYGTYAGGPQLVGQHIRKQALTQQQLAAANWSHPTWLVDCTAPQGFLYKQSRSGWGSAAAGPFAAPSTPRLLSKKRYEAAGVSVQCGKGFGVYRVSWPHAEGLRGGHINGTGWAGLPASLLINKLRLVVACGGGLEKRCFGLVMSACMCVGDSQQHGQVAVRC